MSLNVKTCISCSNCQCHNEVACTTRQSSEWRSHDYGILAVIVSAEDEQFCQLSSKQKVWIMLKYNCCCALKKCLEHYHHKQ